MRLNDTNVARLKPGDVPYIVRDKDLPGFRLRVSGKNKVFKLQIDVRDNGDRKTIYRSLGKAGKVTAAEARAAALKIIADRAAGKISIEKLPKSDPAGLTFAEAWPKYRDAMSEPSPRTVASYQDIVDKFLLKRWPDTPLRAITRDEVKAFHKKISDTNGKYRANGVARIGNAIYKFARLELEAPGMSEANPFRSYKMHNKERARKWGMGLKSLVGQGSENRPAVARNEFVYFADCDAPRKRGVVALDSSEF